MGWWVNQFHFYASFSADQIDGKIVVRGEYIFTVIYFSTAVQNSQATISE
jgi:hypothetical protein